MTPQQGGCLCGEIRFEVDAPPTHVTICHCRFCQHVTGGQYLVEPIFETPHFRLTKGSPHVYDTVSEGSGKAVHLHFCGTCGGRINLTFARFPSVTGVYAGSFDDPDWFPVTPDTAWHIFVGKARHDTMIPGGFAVFSAHSTANDGQSRAGTLLNAPLAAADIEFSN